MVAMRKNIGIYRGKRLDSGKWVTGSLHTYDGIARILDKHDNEWYYVYPTTVGACSGVTDINGNLIFEDDFVQVEKRVKAVIRVKDGIVVCHNGCFMIAGNKLPGVFYSLVDYSNVLRGRVIGNVHDNPELAKE